MKKMILNSEIWANAMREKILEKLQLATTVFCTSTADLHQFREAAHDIVLGSVNQEARQTHSITTGAWSLVSSAARSSG